MKKFSVKIWALALSTAIVLSVASCSTGAPRQSKSRIVAGGEHQPGEKLTHGVFIPGSEVH